MLQVLPVDMVQADGAGTDADFIGARDGERIVARDLKTRCVGRTAGTGLNGQKARDQWLLLGESEMGGDGGRGVHFA